MDGSEKLLNAEEPVFIRKLRNLGAVGLFVPKRGEVTPFKPGPRVCHVGRHTLVFDKSTKVRCVVQTPFKPGQRVCHQNWAKGGLGRQPVPARISPLVIRPRRCRILQDCTTLYIYRGPVCLQQCAHTICRDVISSRCGTARLSNEPGHPPWGRVVNFELFLQYLLLFSIARSAARCEYLLLAFSPADGRRKGLGAYLHNSARRVEGCVHGPPTEVGRGAEHLRQSS